MPPSLDPSSFDHSVFPTPSSEPKVLQDVVDFWFPFPKNDNVIVNGSSNNKSNKNRSHFLNDSSYVSNNLLGWMLGGEIMDEKCRQFRSLIRLAAKNETTNSSSGVVGIIWSSLPAVLVAFLFASAPIVFPTLRDGTWIACTSVVMAFLWIDIATALQKQRSTTTIMIKTENGSIDKRATLISKIILFDQITRNAFRCEEEAYAYDGLVLDILYEIFLVKDEHIKAQHLPEENLQQFANATDVTLAECFFVSIACQHQEEPVFHDVCNRLNDLMETQWPTSKGSFMKLCRVQATSHYEVLKRFGRYPHRNCRQGRKDTKEERAWLDDYDNLPLWAKSQLKAPTTTKGSR